MRYFNFFLICLLLWRCEPVDWFEAGEVEGYVPVYAASEATEVMLLPAQPITKPGKIYVYGKYLLINEVQRGIHVFDNSNIADPRPLAFVRLLGNTDMAIKDNVLYADCNGDLVALGIHDFSQIEELGALPLSKWLLGVPPPDDGYFECIDESKGTVVEWRKEKLINPKCRYYAW